MYRSDTDLFFCSLYILLMKHKDTKHPKLYLKILNYSISNIKVEYVDNEFSFDGKRKIKEQTINNDFSIDESKNLNKLNELELNKLNKYIKVQNKILEYHKRKQNFDSYSVVKDSVKLMLQFKKEYNF